MNHIKTIGILGGMGPRASAYFQTLFVEEMGRVGRVQDHHFPRTITLNIPLKDWDITGSLDDESVADQVKAGVDWLSEAGAEVIAIPCNTVHRFYSTFSRSDVRILDIVTETERLEGGDRFGVLCSRSSRNSALYGDALYPENQAAVDATIDQVVCGLSPDISNLISDLGTKSVILGCTELSLCTFRANMGVRVNDSSRALARALVNSL